MNYDGLLRYVGAAGAFPPCFAFSIHKCGSSLMHTMIRQVCEAANIPHINIPSPLFTEGVGPEWKNDSALVKFIKPGYVFFGFRDLPPIFKRAINFDNARSVLLIRDPRDALVSQYFSFRPGGSHVLPHKNVKRFMEREKWANDETIDSYVLKKAKNVEQKFMDYWPLVEAGHLKIFRYEDIFFDKNGFLMSIFEHFGIDVDDNILSEVARRNDIVPDSEDPSKHIRKGVPGDHKEKLRPETIQKLNAQFCRLGECYEYNF